MLRLNQFLLKIKLFLDIANGVVIELFQVIGHVRTALESVAEQTFGSEALVSPGTATVHSHIAQQSHAVGIAAEPFYFPWLFECFQFIENGFLRELNTNMGVVFFDQHGYAVSFFIAAEPFFNGRVTGYFDQ